MIDGLAALVKEQFHLDPFQKDVLFLFCGCRTDHFKGLVREEDGFCLLYKRIEAGRLRWLRSQAEAARISQEELYLLLTGMTILERSSIRECNCTEIPSSSAVRNRSDIIAEHWIFFSLPPAAVETGDLRDPFLKNSSLDGVMSFPSLSFSTGTLTCLT